MAVRINMGMDRNLRVKENNFRGFQGIICREFKLKPKIFP
jgi:hypothetical protein